MKHEEKGNILVLLLIVMIILSAGLMALMSVSMHEMQATEMRYEGRKALFNALKDARTIQYAIKYSPYDGNGRNEWLLANAPAGVGECSTYFDNGDRQVYIYNIDEEWSSITCVTNIVGYGYQKEVSFRVQGRTPLAEYQLFVNSGAVVDDANKWYGKVHSNTGLNFRNQQSGVGAHFYDEVTTVSGCHDYVESGGVAEATFHAGVSLSDPIEWPDVSDINYLVTKVQGGGMSSYVLKNQYGATGYGEIKHGPNGYYITKGTNTSKVNVEFINDPGNRGKVWFNITDSSGNPLKLDDGHGGLMNIPQYDVPNEQIIMVEGDITALKGEVNGRCTVVSETGHVHLPDDLVYEDNNDEKPYNYVYGGTPDDFPKNPNYTGNSVLGVIAAQNVLFSGDDDDLDLELHGIFAAGVGEKQSDLYAGWLEYWGGFRYKYKLGDYAATLKRNIRLYGSVISYGYHYKGWSGGAGKGFKSSSFRWDLQRPPSFVSIKKAKFAAWRIQDVLPD